MRGDLPPTHEDSKKIWATKRKLQESEKIANIIDPKAPTPAASVGVAYPAKIEPKTKTINAIGGIKDLKTRRIFSFLVLGPIFLGKEGASLGLNLVLKNK